MRGGTEHAGKENKSRELHLQVGAALKTSAFLSITDSLNS
jgi:hypothetical protein